MSVVIPVLLYICLVGAFVLVPRAGPWKARRRCKETASGLLETYGFTADPQAGPELVPWSAPPFHYGRRVQVLDAVRGAFAGLTAEVFGYTCRENGTAHWYGVAVVHLPRQLPPLEVHHDQVFASTAVYYVPAYPQRPTEMEEFDAAYRTSTPDDALADRLIGPVFARVLLTAAEPFDWRVEGDLLVVTRRDGFTSSAALVSCCLAAVHALSPVLDLDPDVFDAPRSSTSGLGA
ncbi:hypothetical protein ABIA33_005917 [Streptacidiphilus sp. MAP12-16]|uniref:hypothetical protein n=1 Tax=Streptacidiphilus sp. MAP12-16 TaxID=3156300 RepID=UPI0035188C20